jgi:hypothetical protein
MLMAPRTTAEVLAQAEELASRFERGELPGPSATHVDGELYRAVFAAFEHRAHADAELEAAIHAARDGGASWAAIGAMVGLSGEAVRSRYGLTAAR